MNRTVAGSRNGATKTAFAIERLASLDTWRGAGRAERVGSARECDLCRTGFPCKPARIRARPRGGRGERDRDWRAPGIVARLRPAWLDAPLPADPQRHRRRRADRGGALRAKQGVDLSSPVYP